MNQELLYLKDSYLREAEAKVLEVKDGKYVILDKVLFYPKGGGQPWDTGVLIKGDQEYKVVYTGKFGGVVSLEVDREGLAPGDPVKTVIDWERRYKLMRMHTAAHILASIFYKQGNAQITGNQLGVDKSRFDFNIPKFDREIMEEYVELANRVVERDLPVKVYTLPYDQAMKIPEIVKLKDALPPKLKELRIVEIPGVDIQADGGTHVKSTGEVGRIKVIKLENKGKNNRRIYFTLEGPSQ